MFYPVHIIISFYDKLFLYFQRPRKRKVKDAFGYWIDEKELEGKTIQVNRDNLISIGWLTCELTTFLDLNVHLQWSEIFSIDESHRCSLWVF